MIGLGNVLMQIPMGMISDRIRDRRHLLIACAAVGFVGVALMPSIAGDWHLLAGVLFLWGGVVAALYTVGLAHLGSRLSGHELANANAAFVLCYGLGMVLGPQAVGIGMDLFGKDGFPIALAAFFLGYLVLALGRLSSRRRKS